MANIAAVAGFLIAVAAAVVAARSLRSQAKSQRLDAIITTNEFWAEATRSTETPVTLSTTTVAAIRRIYDEVLGAPYLSVLDNGPLAREIALRVPFAASMLLPIGLQDPAKSPQNEKDYLADLGLRVRAFGFVRTILDDPELRHGWLSETESKQVANDLQALDSAMARWVNRMNEVAELYGTGLIDRRSFVGKRSVMLLQQLSAAEPYILWRNSTTPGRWGLRVLGLGAEARFYHWMSPLQRAAIRQRVDPEHYGESGPYPGFAAATGWIVGPGTTSSGAIAHRWSEIRIRRRIGSSFRARSQRAQNEFVTSLPTSDDSGLEAGSLSWGDFAADPSLVLDSAPAAHSDA